MVTRALIPVAIFAIVATVAAGCGDPEVNVVTHQLPPDTGQYTVDFKNELNLVISDFVQVLVYDASEPKDATERAAFCEDLKARRKANNLEPLASKKLADTGLVSTCDLLTSNVDGGPGKQLVSVTYGRRAVLVTAHNDNLSRGLDNDFIFVGCGVGDFSSASAASASPLVVSLESPNPFIPFPPSSACKTLADKCDQKCKASDLK